MKNVLINKGSVVKIWHNAKGHDYVLVGDDPIQKEVYLLKANCLNKDGTVHKATKGFHKTLKYSAIGRKNLVKGVTGLNKRKKDLRHYDFSEITPRHVQILHEDKTFICPLKPIE